MQNYAIFPMEMLRDDKYKDFSSKEFFLYTLLLNRVNISKKNPKHFSDKKGFFVYFTNEQIRNSIRCSKNTSTQVLNNLERAGLIQKEYQQKGQPLKIYVNDVIEGAFTNAPKLLQDKPLNKSYSNSNNYTKPYTSHPERNDSETSFDAEISLTQVQKNRRSFGDKKVHKSKKKTENTSQSS